MFFRLSLMAALALTIAATSGCAPNSTADQRLQKELAHMSYAKEPLVTHTDDTGYIYTNAPQETWLESHRFMVPANYFTDQIGPDFQGGVTMELEWPELKPLPPGRRQEMTMPEFHALVRADLNYVDKVPWYESMEAGVDPPDSDPIRRQSPDRHVTTRTRIEDRLGLQHWVVSDADRQRYKGLIKDQPPRRYGLPAPEDIQDWYLRRDAQGRLLTQIACDPPTAPDGLLIEKDHLVRDPAVSRIMSCRHTFAIPKYRALIFVSYSRVLLMDWQRIEETVRANLDRYYIGEGEGWKHWSKR